MNEAGVVSVVDDPIRRQELQQQSAQRRASISTVVLDNDQPNPIQDPDHMDEGIDGS